MKKIKVKSQFKFPSVFSYYTELLKLMLQEKPLPYRTIYCCGGKNSEKKLLKIWYSEITSPLI